MSRCHCVHNLTLLRATDKLYAYAYSRGDKVKLEAAQMIGKHKFRYAYIPFEGTYENALADIQAFRHPVYCVQKDFLEEFPDVEEKCIYTSQVLS